MASPSSPKSAAVGFVLLMILLALVPVAVVLYIKFGIWVWHVVG